jgi:hypothetical protein
MGYWLEIIRIVERDARGKRDQEKRAASPASYFETCRRKRNMLDYDMANVATDTGVRELLEKAQALRQLIEQCVAQQHPQCSA